MNKKIYILIIFVLLSFEIKAQINLVPNPSFEVYDTCPNWYGQIYHAAQWFAPILPSTPDYFNSCNPNDTIGTPNNYVGYQQPNYGNAYIGIFTYWDVYLNDREYVSISLLDTLCSGKKYLTKLYVNLADSAKYAINTIGVYFSKIKIDSINIDSMMHYNPQVNNVTGLLDDTSKWTLIEGNYIATGGEKYIIIGNFKNDLSSNVTYVNSQTPYGVAYYYIDDVSVVLDTTNGINEYALKPQEIKVYPNPADKNILVEMNASIYSNVNISIYDYTGAIVQKTLIKNDLTTIDISLLSAGIYLYRITDSNNILQSNKIIIIR